MDEPHFRASSSTTVHNGECGDQDTTERSSTFATIDRLNEELTQINTQITDLKRRRKAVHVELKRQHSLLSPIRHLPDELLQEIFLFTAEGRVDVCNPTSEIWQFEHISRRWRNVALSFAELWSNINISMETMSMGKVHAVLVRKLLNRCLIRSGSRPLSIKFKESGDPEHFNQVFDHLSWVSHRWKSISFSLSLLGPPNQLENGLHNLRSLGLSGRLTSSKPLEYFLTAPHLTHLHLYTVPHPFLALRLPWHQITHFVVSLCDFKSGEFTNMLRKMPNLVSFTCQWNRGISRANLGPSGDPVVLRHLQSMEIHGSPGQAIINLFEPLVTPALKDLSLYIPSTDGNPSLHIYTADTIIAAIQRSTCSLTSLTLSSMDAGCALRILSETPTVRHLNLEFIPDMPQILYQLAWPNFFLPVLETFSLGTRLNEASKIIEGLSAMVRRRSVPHEFTRGALVSLSLTVKESKGVEGLAGMLRTLGIETGVGIIIHSHPV